MSCRFAPQVVMPAVDQLLGAMMTISEGTFELSVTAAPMVNGDQVVIPVHFAGRRTLGRWAEEHIEEVLTARETYDART